MLPVAAPRRRNETAPSCRTRARSRRAGLRRSKRPRSRPRSAKCHRKIAGFSTARGWIIPVSVYAAIRRSGATEPGEAARPRRRGRQCSVENPRCKSLTVKPADDIIGSTSRRKPKKRDRIAEAPRGEPLRHPKEDGSGAFAKIRNALSSGVGFVLFLTTVAQIPATVAFFAPQPDIASDVALNDGPFSTTFQVINSGSVPIHDVRAACEPSITLPHQGSSATFKQWDFRPHRVADQIPAGEAATFICPPIDIEASDASISLVIKVLYRSWLWPSDRTSKRGFVLVSAQGKWRWLREPVKGK